MIRPTRTRTVAVLFAAAVSAVAAPKAVAQRLLGLDVSAWQGDMSQTTWNNIHNLENRDFVFIRASRGGTTGYYNQSDPNNNNNLNTFSQRYDDPYFVQNITRATNAGMFAGSYHFGRHDIIADTQNSGGIANTGTDEANHMIQMAGPWMRPGYLLPVFDLEGPQTRTDDEVAQFCIDFSDRIHEVMGIRPAIYINGNYAANIIGGATPSLRNEVVAAYPTLWSARWPNQSDPDSILVQTAHPKDSYTPIYGPWDDSGVTHPWSFWQYASTGRLQSFNNGNSNLDMNVAQGGIEFLKDHLVPALWMNDSSGQWTTLSNWNSGQTPVAPVQGPGQVPRVGPLTLPATRLPGVDDTVILDRPSADITVTLASGAHNIRKLFVRETLNLTGGSLNVNYLPHPDSTPISAQFSRNVTMSGSATSFAAHTLLVDAARNFNLNGGTFTLNTAQLTRGTTPAKIVVGGDVTFAPLADATAAVTAVGSGTTPSLDLGGGARTISVADGAASIDLSVDVPINNGTLIKSGQGTMRLTTANTLGGNVTVQRGILLVTGPGQLGNTGVVTTQSADPIFGGTLQLSNNVSYNLPLAIGGAGVNGSVITAPGSIAALDNLSGVNTWAGNITLNGTDNNSAPLLNQIGAAAGTLVLSGVIQDGAGGSWAKTGDGDVVLTGASPNTHSNLTRLFGGRLIIEKDGALGAAGANDGAAGNTFQLAGSASTLAFRAPGASPGLNYSTFEVINTEGAGAPGFGQIDNLGGDNTFAGHIAFAGPDVDGVLQSSIGVTAGSLHVTGGLYARASAAIPRNINKLGPGRLILSGDSALVTGNVNVVPLVNGTFNVNAGTVELRSPSATQTNLPGVAAWSVNPGAAVHLASGLLETTTLNVAGGNVTVAPGAGKTIRAEQLSVTGGGRIDLADNKLIVAGGDVGTFGGSTYTGLTSLIQSAYNFSAWDGPGITTSMPDAGPLIGTTTLAISTADETFYAGGTFGGVPVNSGDVLIMYTYAGDLNLDGLVDAQDYGIIDNWVQFPGTSGYANGDFNYDGVIDASDYGIIDNTIQLQGPPIPVNAASGGLAAATAVPEPAAVSALALFSGAFAIRHRRRS